MVPLRRLVKLRWLVGDVAFQLVVLAAALFAQSSRTRRKTLLQPSAPVSLVTTHTLTFP
jgi:hypothetical protein